MKKRIRIISILMCICLSLSFVLDIKNLEANADALEDEESTMEIVEDEESTMEVVEDEESRKASALLEQINPVNAEPMYESDEWRDDESNEVVYPVDLSSEEWKGYIDHLEMIEACTIPQDIIEEMQTEELVDKILEYPLLGDIYAYDSIQEGMIALASQCNGIQELFEREDAANVLLKKYQDVELVDEREGAIETFHESSAPIVLEGMLGQKEIIAQLDGEEMQILFEEVENKAEEMENIDFYNGEEYTFYEIIDENGMAGELDIEVEIEEIEPSNAEEVQGVSTTTYVKTPNGSKVTVIKYADLSSAKKNQLNQQFKKAYPLATYIATATKKYNCHSYAWYSRSSSNVYWMNNPKKYVSDKSYKYVGKNPTANSQIIVYKYQKVPADSWIHSGVVYSSSKKTITSKWGQAPLMRHSVGYSPYLGQYNAVHYYKR